MSENHKQKILVVHNYYQFPGGEDIVVANEKKMLEDNGYDIVLYTRHNNEIKSMSMLKKCCLPFTSIFSLKTYRDIKKIISDQKIEIIHVHNTLNLISYAVYYAAVKNKIPVVQTIHNFRFLCPGATFYRDRHICEDCINIGLKCAIKHKCYRNSRAQTMICTLSTWLHRRTGIFSKINYIALTEFTKEKLLQNKAFRPDRVFVKPNFTQKPSEISQIKKDNYYIFVGRIEEIKGINIIIEAFKELPEYNLIIIGTGNMEDQVRERIIKEQLSNIELLGFVHHHEIYNYMKKAKALIMCSQWYETFGMVIIEAYSCRTPAIVGRIGNIKDLVIEGETGYTFEYNSKDDLKRAINLFENSDEKLMSKKAYELYMQLYTEKINLKQLESIYYTIVNKTP